MVDLGDFTPKSYAQMDRSPKTFNVLGEQFTINQAYTAMTWMQFAYNVRHAESELDSGAELMETMHKVVIPEDADRFIKIMGDSGMALEDIAEVLLKLLEAVTNRPTKLPSDSSAGQKITSANSTVVSWPPQVGAME